MKQAAAHLAERRAEARKAFGASGVPNRRIEDWKYTDLYNAVTAQTVEAASGARMSINVPRGTYVRGLMDEPLPDWAIEKLAAVRNRGAMDAAAWGFSSSDIAIIVRADRQIEYTLDIEPVSLGNAHIALFVGDGSSLTLWETSKLAGAGVQNIALTVFLGTNARLDHVRLTPFASELVSVETITVFQQSGSQYRAHFADFGAKLSRTELHIALDGESAQAHLSGVSVLDGRHADVTTHVDHAVGNTQSTQIFKNVARGHSRGVYQGKVTVRAGANGSDSRQTAKGLLLSEGAEIDLKPELEILADDVKCAHGAAVGDLDEESIFYLRSRGIPESEARNLLIRAFLEEPIAEIADEAIRASVWKAVEAALTP